GTTTFVDGGWILQEPSEVAAAVEVVGRAGARELVQRDALAAGRGERAARAVGDLEARFARPAARLHVAERRLEVGHAVHQDRLVAVEVVGQQDERRVVAHRDRRDPRAHALDGEHEPAAQHVGEEHHVAPDVVAGRVQEVELLEGSYLHAKRGCSKWATRVWWPCSPTSRSW